MVKIWLVKFSLFFLIVFLFAFAKSYPTLCVSKFCLVFALHKHIHFSMVTCDNSRIQSLYFCSFCHRTLLPYDFVNLGFVCFFFPGKKYLWDPFEAKHKNPSSPREPVLSCQEPKCLLNKSHGLAGFSHLCSIQLDCKYTSWMAPSLFCNSPSLANSVDRLGLLLCVPLIKDVTLDGLRFM